VPDIYFVRDSQSERQQVNASDLVREMKAYGKVCHYLPTFGEIEDHLRRELKRGDVVITMGAGDVFKVAEAMIRLLGGSAPEGVM